MAFLGRHYVVHQQLVRNPLEPGVVYSDFRTGAIPLAPPELNGRGLVELDFEIGLLSEHSSSGTGTIALSGTRTESHVHDAECAGGGGYGDGSYGENTYGGGGAGGDCIYIGTIPLSGSGFDSYIPPGGVGLATQRPRVGYGN